jgi:hypothetical protein
VFHRGRSDEPAATLSLPGGSDSATSAIYALRVDSDERQAGPWRLKISEIERGTQDLADTLAFEAWCREHPERAREWFGPGEPRRPWPLPELAAPHGRSLAFLLNHSGGWTITLTDPSGQEHEGSLEPWRTADPERTYLRTSFERVFED